ncbi:Uncharacterised protein [Mycobacteroides abscessus subsp. abscessus]|nr:Uncharacterised protein [Mycobacteroides abscessus subsp. abscessus]
MQQRVALDLGGEVLQLLRGGQLTVDEQVAHLDEGGLVGELLNRVTAVTQDAGVPVDVGDGALRRCGVDETRIERGVARVSQQLAQREPVSTFGRADDIQLGFASGVLESSEIIVVGHRHPF